MQIKFWINIYLLKKTKSYRFRSYCALMLVLSACLISSNVWSSQQPSFRHLTIDDGLTQNAVYSILQDSRGFMWFATKDGLNRYDGRNFEVYRHNPIDSTTISDAFVMQLHEDSRGRIWIGSISGDVNIFHRETEFFCKIPLENVPGEKATTNEITDITEGPDGSVWIATKGDGLIKILVDEDFGCNYNYRQFLHDPADNRSLNSNRVGNLFFDEPKLCGLVPRKGSTNSTKKVNHFPEPFLKPGIRMHLQAPVNTKSRNASQPGR